MKDVLESLQVAVDSIHLTEMRDGIFYALINLQGGVTVSSRPSDAIALALRTGAPILASEALLEDAGIEIPDQSEDEVERFKEFLDQINPEDFAG
jgi:bifunctional DNase/RNase